MANSSIHLCPSHVPSCLGSLDFTCTLHAQAPCSPHKLTLQNSNSAQNQLYALCSFSLSLSLSHTHTHTQSTHPGCLNYQRTCPEHECGATIHLWPPATSGLCAAWQFSVPPVHSLILSEIISHRLSSCEPFSITSPIPHP